MVFKQSMILALGMVAYACWLPHAAAQKVFRCPVASGGYEFSDVPCSPTEPSEVLKVQPNALSHAGERELQLRRENAQLNEQLKLRDSASSMSPQGRTLADFRAERVDSKECRMARRDYEVTASSRINSHAVIEAKRTNMLVVCGR